MFLTYDYHSLLYTGTLKRRLQQRLSEIPDVPYTVPVLGRIEHRPHSLQPLEYRRLLYAIESEGYGVTEQKIKFVGLQDYKNQ